MWNKHLRQQFHDWAYFQMNFLCIKYFKNPCSLQHFSKKPNVEVKPTVQQMSGQRKCGVYIQ